MGERGPASAEERLEAALAEMASAFRTARVGLGELPAEALYVLEGRERLEATARLAGRPADDRADRRKRRGRGDPPAASERSGPRF